VEVLCRAGIDLVYANDCLSGSVATPCWSVLLQNGWNPNTMWDNPNRGWWKPDPNFVLVDPSVTQEPQWFALLRTDIIHNARTSAIHAEERRFWDQMVSKITDINREFTSGFSHVFHLLDKYDDSRTMQEWTARLLKAGADPRHVCGKPGRPAFENLTSPWLIKIMNEEMSASDRSTLVSHLKDLDEKESSEVSGNSSMSRRGRKL
jgi:hypothetical protein